MVPSDGTGSSQPALSFQKLQNPEPPHGMDIAHSNKAQGMGPEPPTPWTPG